MGGHEKKRSRKVSPNRMTKEGECCTDPLERDLRIVVKSSSSRELSSDQVTSVFRAIDVKICKTPNTSEALDSQINKDGT